MKNSRTVDGIHFDTLTVIFYTYFNLNNEIQPENIKIGYDIECRENLYDVKLCLKMILFYRNDTVMSVLKIC
ncbi:hypothetical protein ACVNPX_04355 [Staphylococcus aureus]